MAGRLAPSASVQLAGASVLRAVARAVTPADAGALAPLLGAMKRYMPPASQHQGISAPQLGVSLRLFMFVAERSSAPLVALNPRVLRRSRAEVLDWEGCLSVPDYAALVSRPQQIDVEFETPAGDVERCVLSGDRARVFQHELDHLDGILFTERCVLSTFAHASTLRSEKARQELLTAAYAAVQTSGEARRTAS